MTRPLASLAVLVVLGSACAESEPTIAYQYVVRGQGDNVAVTYLSDQGVIDEEVSLPWTSDEFEGTKESAVRLRAEGPEGSKLRCIIRHRPIDGRYGGNGSGESSQSATSGGDQTQCSMREDHISTGS